jgi:hypothetical protein
VSSITRALYAERVRFDRALMAELRPLLKGTPWKKARNALVTQTGDYFQEVLVCVNFAEHKTTLEWSVKPMAIDTILWAIDDCPECRRQPLSFRSSGLNTCKGLRIFDAEVESRGDTPATVARAVVELCQSKREAFRELITNTPFSTLIAGYRARETTPWLGPELAVSLISEGQLERARDVALEYAMRQRKGGGIFAKGRSQHDQIVDWLDSGGPSRLAQEK